MRCELTPHPPAPSPTRVREGELHRAGRNVFCVGRWRAARGSTVFHIYVALISFVNLSHYFVGATIASSNRARDSHGVAEETRLRRSAFPTRERFPSSAAMRYTILVSERAASNISDTGCGMQVRQATLDDTRQIVALFVSRIPVWQRFTADGQVEELPYDELTIYDRWLHGGAWMTLETGAIWLSHILSGSGFAYVIEAAGEILAYAEAFVNRELTPMNTHLHLAQLLVDERCSDDVHHLLAESVLSDARGPGRLSVAYPDYDKALATYYRGFFGTNEVVSFDAIFAPRAGRPELLQEPGLRQIRCGRDRWLGDGGGTLDQPARDVGERMG